MTRNQFISAVVLVSSVNLFGCGGGGNPGNSARVSGALTYKGQPIRGGVMNFFNSEGVAYEAKISPDGTYAANDIGTGELIVTVDTEPLNPQRTGAPKGAQAEVRMKANASMMKRPDAPAGAAAAAEKPTGNYIQIPKKYANSKTSPLTITVKSGRNVLDIDLTD